MFLVSRLFLLIIIITGNPSVVGYWRIERAVLEDEVVYDRRDSTICKENFINRQKRVAQMGTQYYDLQMQPFTYDMFRKSIENSRIHFFDNGEFQSINYFTKGNTWDSSKGRYQFLPSEKLLLMTEDDQTDTVIINLSDTTMEWISKSQGSSNSYLYSRIK